jgi:hypothetical protein
MRERGDGGFRGGCGTGRGGGRSNNNKVSCQVCGKTSHTTLRCYKRSDDKYVNVATSSYNIDTDWYTTTVLPIISPPTLTS